MRQREDVLAYGNYLFPKLTIIFLMFALALTQFSLVYAQTASVSGNVFEDANGLMDGVVNGTGISKAGNVQLYATLLDSSGFVVESVPVAAGGAYSFSAVAAGDYSIQLSTTDETFKTGMLPSTVPLVPPDWQFTGENLGAGPGDDGAVNGLLGVTVGTTAVTDANFGIKQQDTDGDSIPDSVDPDYDGNGINDVSEGICYNIEFGGDHTNVTTPAVQNTWIMHSGKSAYKDDNNNKIRRIVGNPDLSTSPDLDVSNLVPNNLTLTYLPGPESYQVTDVSSATLAEAKANGEYIEVIFKTDSSFSMAAIDWVGFLNRPDNQPGFSVTYSISSDGGNTFNDLAAFVEAADQNIGSFPDGRRNADIDPYYLARNTEYIVRYYFYAVGSGVSSAIEFDDPYLAFDVCSLIIRGNVYHDENELTDNHVNGTGINAPAGTPLYATLLSPTGNVVASVPVNADGTFLFINVEANTNYTVQIDTTNETPNVGRPPSTGPSLPGAWHDAGEDCCDDTGDDGSVNGLTSVSVGMSNVDNVNFGINDQFLAVTVAYVSSARNGEQLTIHWQTATESGVAGFNLLAETPGGLRELNASLIPSQVIDSVEATDYSVTLLTDADTFYIEEVRLSGTTDRMGPYQVGESYGVRDGGDSGSVTNSIFLPLIR